MGDVDVFEVDGAAALFVPGFEAGAHGGDGGEAAGFEFVVDVAAA